MLEKTGIPTSEDIDKVKPNKKRLKEGPVAVIECFKEIPCDPCFYSCPFGAIKEFEDINDRPELIAEKCTGCGNCIASCPGLAIFVVDYKKKTVSLPYEFLPLPEKGKKVLGLGRAGNAVCEAEVIKIRAPKNNDKTAVVTIKVPEKHLMEVRNIEVGELNE
ncbi:MAG TPA: 4Fe-4S dicluster domain-containing protein [Halanaerobiales bacterium]|nr:4Fe-4S dicluster domain-containing protein [Halanaerobiales bacterium]